MALTKTAELTIPTGDSAEPSPHTFFPLTGNGTLESPLTMEGGFIESNLYSNVSATEANVNMVVLPSSSTNKQLLTALFTGYVQITKATQTSLFRFSEAYSAASTQRAYCLVIGEDGSLSKAQVTLSGSGDARTVLRTQSAPLGTYLINCAFNLRPNIMYFDSASWSPITTGQVGTPVSFDYTVTGTNNTTTNKYFDAKSDNPDIASVSILYKEAPSDFSTITYTITITPNKPGVTRIGLYATKYTTKTFTFTVTE